MYENSYTAVQIGAMVARTASAFGIGVRIRIRNGFHAYGNFFQHFKRQFCFRCHNPSV